MKTTTVRQSVFFRAPPHEVYEALADSSKHSEFTGSKAVISRKAGGAFSAWDGGLHGKNLALAQDRRIVQAWRCEMAGWPRKHFSRASFELRPEKAGTRLDFVQTGVPAECAASIAEGWRDYYWRPMKEFLER